MAKQRRQPPAAKRGAGKKRTKRLVFECLERRTVLSAGGLPMALPPGGIALPAYVGDMQPHHAEAANSISPGMTALRASDVSSMPDVQSGAPMHRDGDRNGIDSDHAALLPVTSISFGADSLVTVEGEVVVSPEVVPSLAAPSFLFAELSAPWMAISALEAPVSTSIGIDISPSGVSLLFVSTGVATDLLLQQIENVSQQPLDAAGDSAYETQQVGDPDGPLGGGHGQDPNATTMFTGSSPGTGGDWQFPGGPGPLGPFVFTGPAVAVSAGGDQLDSTAAAPPLRGDLPMIMDVYAAAAAHKFDSTTARDVVNVSGGTATDGAMAATAPFAAQYEWSSNVNTADTVLSNLTETGLVAIDFGSLPALRLAAAAPDSSASATGDLDGTGLAAVLSLAAQKSPAQGNGGVQASSASSFALGETARAGDSTANRAALDAAEGGVIDLGGTAPIAAVVADGGGDTGVVHDANGIRPQSSVGLFCDMEVAVRGPVGEVAQSPSLPAPGAESRAAKLDEGAVPNNRPPQDAAHRPDPWQRASAALSDGAPLVMGTVLVAVMGRIRLEPVNSDRERRFREVDPLGREPRK